MASLNSHDIPKVQDFLSREEIKAFCQRSDFWGFSAILVDWSIIAGAFALVVVQPRWYTIMLSLLIIGGRQLGLAILMHEAAHRSLFKTRVFNDFFGHFFCAAPVWQRLRAYRPHHLAHHKFTGTERDTDIGLVRPYPVSRSSLFRKMGRDLFLITGIKRVFALFLMDFGYLSYTASTGAQILKPKPSIIRALRLGFLNFGPVVLCNTILFALLWSLGHPELYLLWVFAYLSPFSLFVRLRSIAEHAGCAMNLNPFRNTRSTHANLIARLFVAPHRVNFHLEHHLLMTVPYFQLPRLHRLLKERGAFESAELARGYVPVLLRVSAA